MNLKAILAAALATAGVAALPSIASAETICVNAGCQTHNLATPQSALDAAAATPGPDTIKIGPNDNGYFGQATYTATGVNNDVAIQGVFAGGRRPLFRRGGIGPIISITGSGSSSLSNIDVSDSGTSGETAVELFGAKASHIHVEGFGGATGVSLNRSTLDHSSVFMGTGGGVLARGDANAVRDSIVAGDPAVQELGGDLVIDRSTINGRTAGVVGTGDRGPGHIGVDIRSSLVTTSEAFSTGVSLTDVGIAAIRRSTIASTAATPASSSTALAQASIAKTTSTVLEGVVLDGFGRRLRRTAGGSNRAHINATRSEWDATGDSLGSFGVFTESGDVHGDPKLVNPAGLDFRLRGTDKAVDLLGDPGVLTPFDRGGNGSVDGDGNGILAADAGANEYRRTAPVLTPVSLPATGTAGKAVAFAVKAKDADGDAISVKWGFGDGTTATGASTSHVFAKPGTYNVLATVKDAVGLTDTRGVEITIK